MKKAKRQVKRKRREPLPGFSEASVPPVPPQVENEEVTELESWPMRRMTAEDERRRIAATFRDMGIGTD